MVRKPARSRHRYTVLYEDGRQERDALALGRLETEADAEFAVMLGLATYFAGYPIERVHLIVDGATTDMFVLEFALDRPVNEEATRLFRATMMLAYPDRDPTKMPHIAGTAVLFDKPIWPRAES